MSCDKCDLAQSCSNVKISSKLKEGADILIVLDAPDRDDDFSDAILARDAGKKMLYFLDRAEVPKDKVAYTYAVRCKPKSLSKIKRKHLEACRDYLMQEIITMKPKIVVLMGRYAHESLTGETSIREFRGHFDSFSIDFVSHSGRENKFKVNYIPTFSVYGSMSEWTWNDYIIHDLKKAYNASVNGIPALTPVPQHRAVLSLKDLKDFRESLFDAKWSTTDFETTGLNFWEHDPFVAGYSTSNDDIWAVYHLPYLPEMQKKWSAEDKAYADEINRFTQKHYDKVHLVTKQVHEKVRLILHNGKFDAKFARKLGFPYKKFVFDTLLADSYIDENKQHSLNIAMEYRGINFGAYDTKLWEYIGKKGEKTYQHIPPSLIEFYLARDTYGDSLLFRSHIKELKDEGLYEYFMGTKMEALRIMTDVEYHGVRADRQKILAVDKLLTEKILAIEEEAKRITGNPDFNIGSGKQVSSYMVDAGYPFEKLKIRKTQTGYSTDKEALGMFAKYKKWCTFPRLVLQHKSFSKVAGTYVAGKAGRKPDEIGGMLQYLDANDRIHANFNLWSPRTGRYSCRAPSLQVWPRPIKDMPNIRNFICSEEGWELTEMDYSQLEQCVVAAISRDLVLIEKIMNGVDLHCFNAVELGKKLGTIDDDVSYEYMMTAVGKGLDLIEQLIDYDSIPEEIRAKFKELRTQAKAIGFGLNYGKSAITFAEDFGIEIEDAEDMVDAYFMLYKGMKKWRDNIVEEALTKGVITLISGRKRRFHQAVDWINSNFAEGLWSTKKLREEISRQAMNSPIQGGAHDIFEPAKIRIVHRIKKEGLKARLLLSIHDGMVFENPVSEREALKRIIREEAVWSLNTDTKYQVNFKVDVDTYKITDGDTKAHWYGEKLKE